MNPPIRIGIMGAAPIAPMTLIGPAKSHPDIAVTTVACRDPARGAAFAKKHGLPKNYGGSDAYQQLISDEDIDAVYIPLPNGLHFEWTMRALQAGKHVIVEKPMTNTAGDARQVYALAEKKGLVVIAMVHFIFHPALHRVRALVASGDLGKVVRVSTHLSLPGALRSVFFRKDDPRLTYSFGGGCMMDMGGTSLVAAKFITGTDTVPLEVTSAHATGHALDPARVDSGMHATFALPGDTDAEVETVNDFMAPGWGPFGLLPTMLKMGLTVTLERGEVYLFNFLHPGLFHFIRVKPTGGRARYSQAYVREDGSGSKSWDSHRYLLDGFIDKIRGRTPAYWPEPEVVISCMETLDRVYEKAGMPVRPASEYKPEVDTSTAGN